MLKLGITCLQSKWSRYIEAPCRRDQIARGEHGVRRRPFDQNSATWWRCRDDRSAAPRGCCEVEPAGGSPMTTRSDATILLHRGQVWTSKAGTVEILDVLAVLRISTGCTLGNGVRQRSRLSPELMAPIRGIACGPGIRCVPRGVADIASRRSRRSPPCAGASRFHCL